MGNLHQLFTEGRLPPWRIRDLEQHYKINVASLLILFVVYLGVKIVASHGGSVDILSTGALYAVALLALLFVGVVVRYFNADETEATKLTNRWSTFLIVSFAYCLFILALLILFQAIYLNIGGRNLFVAFNAQFSENWQGLALLSLIVAAFATTVLWGRTRKHFPDFRETAWPRQGGILALALAVVAVVFYLATFGPF